jgi:hypothetical protein
MCICEIYLTMASTQMAGDVPYHPIQRQQGTGHLDARQRFVCQIRDPDRGRSSPADHPQERECEVCTIDAELSVSYSRYCAVNGLREGLPRWRDSFRLGKEQARITRWSVMESADIFQVDVSLVRIKLSDLPEPICTIRWCHKFQWYPSTCVSPQGRNIYRPNERHTLKHEN